MMTDHPGVTGRKSGRRRGKTSAADIAAAKSEFDRKFDVDTGADIADDDAPSALSLVKSPPKAQAPPKSTAERDAYTIEEFCQRHAISRGTYYNLRAADKGPKEARALGRVLITRESAELWRRARELEETA